MEDKYPQFMANDDVNKIEVRNLLQMSVMTRKRYHWDF